MDKQERSGPRSGKVLLVNPLSEPDVWDSFVAEHSDCSLFHTSIWARVLHETYGHTPVYLCRQHPDGTAEMLPIMEVNSPCTGRRGVSLPFTDKCSFLGSPCQGQTDDLYEEALKHGRVRGWKYLETRGGRVPWRDATPSVTYWGHQIDLARSEKDLFDGLHSSVRRGIRKAEASGLQITRGVTLELMRKFYELHCRTRRRHGVPPQPFRFFENITRYVLAEGHGCVFAAAHGGRVVAAAVFFHYGKQAIYKFGASDLAFQGLRPNNLLMWEAIRWHARCERTSMHLGRTSLTAAGLRRFKLGFGAREDHIEYCRYDIARDAFVTDCDRSESWHNRVFRCLPLPVLRFAGNVLYPHLS